MRLLLFIVLFFIIGCQEFWHFTIIDITDPMYPQFCISGEDDCMGDGVILSNLTVWEVDKDRNHVKKVWGLVCSENVKIKTVKYGHPPDGYRETVKAEPIKVKTLYSVNDMYYFRLTKKEKGLVQEIYSLKERYNISDPN